MAPDSRDLMEPYDASCSLTSSALRATMAMPRRSASAIDLRLVEQDGHFAFDRQHAAARLAHRLNGVDADGRHVEPHVLLRLGHLDDREAATAAESARPANRRVGAFDRLTARSRPCR